jgi:hypothetical protein
MHIYAFGSLCRGEVDPSSDVDLLAIIEAPGTRFDPEAFSTYSYARIRALWLQGNPFAWHLSLEAKMIFASDGRDFLESLGRPNRYIQRLQDCEKFHAIFRRASASLTAEQSSYVFDLSTIFLSLRNIATCFSLGAGAPTFSRHSARSLGDLSLSISDEAYDVLQRARVLSTRGFGARIEPEEVRTVLDQISVIDSWMINLVERVRHYE